MSNQHVLKIHPAPLADLLSGAKTAEVRRNDRDFQVGDTVRLMEVNPETGNWTGAADHVRTISHIQTGYGLPDDLCVLSYGKVGHDYKAHWMGFMDRTDWMQEKGQVPAKYLGQHRADILTDMLLEAREALARVEAAAKENLADERRVTSFVHTLLAAAKSERDTAQAQLAEAVGKITYLVSAFDGTLIANQVQAMGSAKSFLARHAQMPNMTAEQSVAISQRTRDAYVAQAEEVTGNSRGPAQAEQQEARPATFYDAIKNPPRLPPRLKEAQGAQAGDERAAFEDFFRHRITDNRGDNRFSRSRLTDIYLDDEVREMWSGWRHRAALATQPAVPVTDHPVVKALLEVAAAAHLALEGTDSDGVDSSWDEADRESLDAAIGVLDRLPDDQPGFTMEPAAKAAWALRNLNAVRGAEHDQ